MSYTDKHPKLTELQIQYILASRKSAARRQRLTLAAVSVGLVMALLLAIVAFVQSIIAERERDLATARGLLTNAQINLTADPDLSMLLASGAVSIIEDEADEATALDLLRQAVQVSYLEQTLDLTSFGQDVAYNTDGTLLATASYDGLITLWHTTSWQKVMTFSIASPAWSIAFNRDGSLLAAGDMEGTVTVWDVAGGEIKQSFIAHDDRINDIAFSPDGARLATASRDKTAKIWDAASGEVLMTLSGHINGLRDVAFSPDGTRLATASEDRTGRIYLLNPEELLQTARSRLEHTWTEEACAKYLPHLECPPLP